MPVIHGQKTMGITSKFSEAIGTIFEGQKSKFQDSKAGTAVANYLEKEFKLKNLLPLIKWAGIGVGAFIADATILGALSGGIFNSISNATAAFKGLPPSDLVGPGWYLTHPFKISGIFLRHMFGAPINITSVYNTWIGLNIFCGLGLAGGIAYKRYAALKNKRDEAGTSEFVEPEKVKDMFSYSYTPGIMFGGIGDNKDHLKPVILRPKARSNLNVAVFGPPGSMKSAGYIKTNIMQAVVSNWSIVVTDPKGEMVKEYAVWLEKQGYVVKIFNLKEMLNSDQWNPLLEVHDGTSAQDFCDVVIASTSAPARKGGGEDFWKTAELNLLKALILYVVNELPQNQRNLGVLYLMLASGDSKQLDQIFSMLPSDHPAKLPYNLFCESSGVVRTGVVMGLGNRLGVFQEKLVRELTSVCDETCIDLTLPGRQKCAYFCVMSDSRSTFDFLASLFFSFFFGDLMALADSNESGKLDVPVNFLLDEFCNIPGIPDFPKKLSTMRSRGIACSIIFQNIPQLEQYYPFKMWEIILGDCDYWL
ncbi:MAG: type IV secretory system conjugative DNA transfer family protein, partial [Syntrophomonadaceae bacterium]|nr:type IV secretory system conjugative DNA transfer family protein [Syntrophomonadaceae bacterium]